MKGLSRRIVVPFELVGFRKLVGLSMSKGYRKDG